MAEDRALEDTTERLRRLVDDHEDLKSTVLRRMLQQPTGDIEPTLRTSPKVGTLLLNGQTVSRTVYADLWAWAQGQGLVAAGLFTTGDGTSTFGLPDFRGRATVGADAARAVGALFGSQTKTMTVDNLPAHRHTGGTAADNPSHTHYSWGNHGGHRPGVAPGVGGSGASWPTTAESFSGDVGWSGNASGPHYHGFTTDAAGGNVPLNVEAPSIAINFLIWT